ncbi:MAG: rhomboid family intramembrane serine protease [Isosphaeraceae bacterium]
MRQIGTIPRTLDPSGFCDYLLSQGISTRVNESSAGWEIWVHNEDRVAAAREQLQAYLADPSASQYRESAQVAEGIRREEKRRDRAYQRQVRDLSGRYDGLNFRGRPLTIILMAICIPLFLVTQLSPRAWRIVWDNLGFFPYEVLLRRDDLTLGLKAIHEGQVWRLVTPALLHVNTLHLIFNMWATWIEGTLIEYCKGTRTLFLLFIVSAVTSNIGQYLYEISFEQRLTPWGGISGVGYALFGYIWMKSEFDRSSGIRLPPGAVRTMILWLLLGFTGVINMANGAHVTGLIVGILFGLAGL